VLKKILIVVAVLMVVVVFLLTKDYDSPELGQKLLDEVGDATGVTMTATGFRFNLFKGVELDNVTASSSSPGRQVDYTLDQLVFEHRILPLLSGTVAIDRVVLDSPRFEIAETPSEAAPAGESAPAEPPRDDTSEDAPAADRGLALDVKQILVRNGSMVMRNTESGSETRVEGLDFTMENLKFDPAAKLLAAVSAAGELTIAEVNLDALALVELESRFTLSNAVFELSELKFATRHGQFAAEANVDFNPVPFTYSATATGKPLDLNGMLGATEGMGPAEVQLAAEGEGADTKDVDANGGLKLAGGAFPDVDAFSGIDRALGKQVVVGAPYEATELSFVLDNNVIRVAPFRFTTELARLDLQGTISLLGPIDLGLSVATPREGIVIEGASATVLDVLSDDDGWVPVPMTITGTLDEARVRPDAKALMAQAGQGAKREAKEAAAEAVGNALGGLLGGRKKKN
jgi:uncharacterized protein involved in outer membrane biogenesis